MTTIVGLKTSVGPEAIVLVADYTATSISKNSDMNQMEFKKLYCSNNFAFTISGGIKQQAFDFLDDLKVKSKKSKRFIDVKSGLELGFFPEVKYLNLDMGAESDTVYGEGTQLHFIFASRFNRKLGLHYVYPMGGVDEHQDYVCGGSGSEFIEDLMNQTYTPKSLEGTHVDLEKAIKLADECMNLARQDVFSGGRIIDFAIITKNSIDYYGDSLREDLENFRNQKLDEIIRKYV